MNLIKKNKTAGKYIISGLMKTGFQMLSSLVILRWIEPEELGLWQSFMLFMGYITILNAGVTSGINRELPYWLGKGDQERSIELLKTAGSYIRILGAFMIVLVLAIGLILYYNKSINLQGLSFLTLAIVLTVVNQLGKFIGATYRSSDSFNKLANMQFLLSILFIVLMPLIYYFGIFGYVFYLIIISLLTYILFSINMPFKVKYSFNLEDFIYLIKVGFPIYFWNYINAQIQSFPRLVLVLLGTPYLVGLFAPASSIKQVMLNFPKYTNRYLFPRMSYSFGKTDNQQQVSRYAFKSAKYMFAITFLGGVVLAYLLNFLFPIVFPKYTEGIVAAQITVFTGVTYGVNLIFHNALNVLKQFKVFKIIIGFKLISILLITSLLYIFLDNLLITVAIAALSSEFFSTFIYVLFLKRVSNLNKK